MNQQQTDKVIDESLAFLNQYCKEECDGFETLTRCYACPQEAAKQRLAVARTKEINGKW